MKFSKRIGNMLIESCNSKLRENGEHTTAIICCIRGSGCQEKCSPIGYWIRSGDGYYFRFVFGIPYEMFDNDYSHGTPVGIDWDCFGEAMSFGQKRLDNYFLGREIEPLSEAEKIEFVAHEICPNCLLHGCQRSIENLEKCVVLRVDSHEELKSE